MLRIDFARFVAITAGLAGAHAGACAAGKPAPAPAPIVATAPEVEVPDASTSDDDALDGGASGPTALGPSTEVSAHGEDPGSEGDRIEGALGDPSGEVGVSGIGGLVGGSGGAVGQSGHGVGWGPGPKDGGAAAGSLEPAVIARVVRANVSKIKACYEAELKADPAFQTKVVVKFVIGTQGKVSTVSLATASGKPSLDRCLLAAVKRWRFPAPDGGVVTVSYPFVFKAS